MFEICGWKSAPTTVARNWATKSVMHYRDPARGGWYTNHVEPSSEFTSDLRARAITSPLLTAIRSCEALSSVRSLRTVTCNGDPVKVGDWAVVRQVGEQTQVGRITEMMECVRPGEVFSFIRVRCEMCKTVNDDEMTGAVWAASGESNEAITVSFEKVHLEVVMRSVTPVRDELV